MMWQLVAMRCWQGYTPRPGHAEVAIGYIVCGDFGSVGRWQKGHRRTRAPEGSGYQVFASNRTLRRGELQGRYEHLSEERLSTGHQHTGARNTGVRLVP